jgi:hypothetical protein
MKSWSRSPGRSTCGYCGSPIALGLPMLTLSIPGQKRVHIPVAAPNGEHLAVGTYASRSTAASSSSCRRPATPALHDSRPSASLISSSTSWVRWSRSTGGSRATPTQRDENRDASCSWGNNLPAADRPRSSSTTSISRQPRCCKRACIAYCSRWLSRLCCTW